MQASVYKLCNNSYESGHNIIFRRRWVYVFKPATEMSRTVLNTCEFSGSHGGEDDDGVLLGDA
jgi:hypothetical protein